MDRIKHKWVYSALVFAGVIFSAPGGWTAPPVQDSTFLPQHDHLKRHETSGFPALHLVANPLVVADADSLDVNDAQNSMESLDEDDSMDVVGDDEEIMLDAARDEELLDFGDGALHESGVDTSESGSDFEIGGKIVVEDRYFYRRGIYPGQNYHNNLAVIVEPEMSYQWDDGNQFLVFKPFFIGDQHDNIRTHFDIRELMWDGVFGRWEWRFGIGKVFWGVMEHVHLVDIINQTDMIMNIDTEDKFGQAMINLAYTTDFGTFDFFVLPFFRERSFPGGDGRLRGELEFAGHSAIYESAARKTHVDFAARWAHTLGSWDIGLAHFHGTTREPRLVLSNFNESGVPTRLSPLYEIIDQTSLDIQGVTGNWLWKLEALTRSGQGARRAYSAAVGLEYTFSGVLESGADLGFLLEYLYNSRPYVEITKPFEHDLFMGLRLGMNDVQSTELLAGVIKDLDTSTWAYSIEASRRIGERWKVALEARGFIDVDAENYVFQIRKDDYMQLEVEWYF